MPAGRPRGDRRLAPCREAGLGCQECVAAAAGDLAAISADLSGAVARQLFFLMYPAAACAPMATAFVQILNARTSENGMERARVKEEPARWQAAVA